VIPWTSMPWLEDLKFPRGYQMGTHIIKYDYENIPSYHPEDLKEYLNIFKENNINAFF
jgi:hypothetical protein